MKKNKSGFSLVELIVAMTVIMVLTGIGVTSFSKLVKTKELTTAKSEILSWLSLSKSLAMTGQLPSKNLGLKYVKVTFDGVSFVVSGVKDDGSIESTPFFTKLLKEADIDDVTVSIKNDDVVVSDFGFNKGTGRLVDSNGNFTNGPIKLELQSVGGSDFITIDDLGTIDEK